MCKNFNTLYTGICTDVGSSSMSASDTKIIIENNEAATITPIIVVVLLAIGLFVTILMIFALIKELMSKFSL